MASRQVAFEIDMLIASATTWMPNPPPGTRIVMIGGHPSTRVAGNWMIGVCAIQTRALEHFMYRDWSRQERDILAIDYFDAATDWEIARPAVPGWVQRASQATSQQVAHIGRGRPPFTPSHIWDVLALAAFMVEATASFVDAVKLARIDTDEWTKAKIGELTRFATRIESLSHHDRADEDSYSQAARTAWHEVYPGLTTLGRR